MVLVAYAGKTDVIDLTGDHRNPRYVQAYCADMTADETLNELLVCLFKDLTEIEGRCLITDEFSDISINDMHIIEAIGVDEPKRSGTVAKLISITLGTLTKAIDGLTRKGYVNRIRSEEEKRVVKLSLTDKVPTPSHIKIDSTIAVPPSRFPTDSISKVMMVTSEAFIILFQRVTENFTPLAFAPAT